MAATHDVPCWPQRVFNMVTLAEAKVGFGLPVEYNGIE